jgi:hypothetical protein
VIYSFQETSEPGYKKRRVVSAHAKATMVKFFNEVSQTPDQVALLSISEVLNLEPDIISRFFEKRRKNIQNMNENEKSRTDASPGDDEKVEDIAAAAPDVPEVDKENNSGKGPLVIFASVTNDQQAMEVDQNENHDTSKDMRDKEPEKQVEPGN